MDFPSLMLLAVGLSMDAMSVAAVAGLAGKRLDIALALKLALAFGVFQALMPALGWAVGAGFSGFFCQADHWVAFLLLGFIGSKMIAESGEPDEDQPRDYTLAVILVLAVATSIDALAAGLSLAMLSTSILLPVTLIGCTTFVLSLAGVVLGRRFGRRLGGRVEVLGGLILIAIGFKILIQHVLDHPIF